MKKNISNLLILFVLFTLLILIILFSKDTISSASLGFDIWKNTIFPSLFPFFVISDLLISYGFIDIVGNLTKNITNKLFNLPKDCSFVIITSMLTGFPSSAKYIKELLDQNRINIKQAEHLLTFTHFSNPLFVIGTIGNTLLNNSKIGLIILLCHILSNFIIGVSLRTKEKVIDSNQCKVITKKNIKLVPTLTNSIFKSLNTLILILGILTTFLVLSSIIINLINTNELNNALISGILEMTQGIIKVSSINIPISLKSSIIAFFISFGGISIHIQTLSILSDYNIKYKYYLISRLIHALLSSILVFIILLVW